MASFSELGLSPLLLQALKRRGFEAPSRIQRHCIPAVLQGKDVLALSKTGTGKTLAYLLPLLQKLMAVKEEDMKAWMALILVPTKELIVQVSEESLMVITACGVKIGVSAFPGVGPKNAAGVLKGDVGSIVVCTPRQISALLQTEAAGGVMWGETLETLVVDEADLILSYGYDADMRFISPKVPRSCQCILASATRSSDLDCVVKLVMENPMKIDLLRTEMMPVTVSGVIGHYYLECSKEERAVHLLVLLQCRAVEQPAMIFVNSIQDGYRLRLFLECFRVSSALLHRELPLNARQQLIDDFNKGRHQVFIVVDDLQVRFMKEENLSKKKKRQADDQKKKKKSKEAEFGVARGLDFKNVKTVINFDVPQSLNGYLHRVGRTGRAGSSGMALTFLSQDDRQLQEAIGHHLNETMEAEGSHEDVFRPFLNFDRERVTSLKYRAADVMHALKRKTIDAARKKDIRQELLRCAELQSYFEAHPEERRLLEKMQTENPKRKFSNINKLPAYILTPENSVMGSKDMLPQNSRKVPKLDPLSNKIPSRRPGRRNRRRNV